MNANLVCAPGFQAAVQQCAGSKFFQHPVMRACRFAILNDCHAGAVDGVSANRRIYYAIFFKFTQHECEIMAFDSALLQLSGQIELCLDRFGDDQQAGGILVQPVNDTSTWYLAEAAGHD